MRQVVDLVRGKKVAIARDVLRFSKTRGSKILLRFLDSAIATAKSLGQGDESSLMVLKIAVDEGPKLKRWRARAKGSAYSIQKKVSHITLILDEAKGAKPAQTPAKTAKEEQETAKKGQAVLKTEKPKFKAAVSEMKAPKIGKGVQRFFRKSGEK
jgi:large subunit ribosomal protein L22